MNFDVLSPHKKIGVSLSLIEWFLVFKRKPFGIGTNEGQSENSRASSAVSNILGLWWAPFQARRFQSGVIIWHQPKPHLANGPWKKSLNFIFPTKYGIPKSLKPVSHWLSKKQIHCYKGKIHQHHHTFAACLSRPTRVPWLFYLSASVLNWLFLS